MHEYTAGIVGNILSMEQDLKREFEILLADSSKLAFRVAFSVLRHSENAEDVAQEAFAKAYASFRDLRDRERFRAWLVRMTWRLAINRLRSDRRRSARESIAMNTPRNPTPAQTILEKEPEFFISSNEAAAIQRLLRSGSIEQIEVVIETMEAQPLPETRLATITFLESVLIEPSTPMAMPKGDSQ